MKQIMTLGQGNRLIEVSTVEGTTRFFYDSSGQRTTTLHPDGTVVYTPFPHHEREEQLVTSVLRPSLCRPHPPPAMREKPSV